MIKLNQLFVILNILVFAPILLFGNGAYFGEGNIGTGQLELMKSENVQIIKEKLNINLCKGYAEVIIEYDMKNSGPADAIKIGYPAIIHDSPQASKQEIEEYSISDNERELKFQYIRTNQKLEWLKIPVYDWLTNDERGIKLNWYVSKIDFKENEIKKIKISFISNYLQNRITEGDFPSGKPDELRYFMSLGSTWKDTIREGTVTINAKCLDPEKITIFPENRFIRNGKEFQWKFKDLKPTSKDNILIYNNILQVSHCPITTGRTTDNPEDGPFVYKSRFDNNYYIPKYPTSIHTSSCLTERNRTYSPEKGDIWVEGKPGDGIGEYIQMEFEKPETLQSIGIINGFNGTRQQFYKNSRVAKLEIVINDEFRKTIDLDDGYTSYRFDDLNSFSFYDISC
ncbi:MAG: hypothetical protein JW982_03325 [Spirochaetes bacterium]|nr:hypothetical protein [Spirochaetota bacterium]